jgi:hypothetical protein
MEKNDHPYQVNDGTHNGIFEAFDKCVLSYQQTNVKLLMLPILNT